MIILQILGEKFGGMENSLYLLVHDYYQVDDKELWNVIQDDLPILRQQIMEYILTSKKQASHVTWKSR